MGSFADCRRPGLVRKIQSAAERVAASDPLSCPPLGRAELQQAGGQFQKRGIYCVEDRDRPLKEIDVRYGICNHRFASQ